MKTSASYQRPPDCEDGTLERSLYPVNRGFSQLACCMAFNVYEVIHVACLSHNWFIYYLFLGGHICALKTNMVSPYKASQCIYLGKMFPKHLADEISHRSDSW